MANSQLRIIGGRWRGRKFSFTETEGLRPTGDRIRETLFNWLAPEINGARCLDLFSGSGALGLEALSRGAAHVTMLEKSKTPWRQIQSHLSALGGQLDAQRVKLENVDSIQWLQQEHAQQNFHIVFIDPPFKQDLWARCISALCQPGVLAEQAAIYIETPRNQTVNCPANWRLHRSKDAGHVSYQLYYAE